MLITEYINKLENRLYDLIRLNKINLKDIRILFEYKELKKYIKLVNDENSSDEFKNILITEFISDSLEYINELVNDEIFSDEYIIR